MLRFKQREFSFLNPLHNITLFSFEWYFLEWINPTTVIGFDLKVLNVRFRFELYREIPLQKNEYLKGSLNLDKDKIKCVLFGLKGSGSTPQKFIGIDDIIKEWREKADKYNKETLQYTAVLNTDTLKVGDRVAIPFATTRDTAIIRHGVIDYINEIRLLCGVALEMPEIGRCVISQPLSLLLPPDVYPEGSVYNV